jgi:hypothetical protein
MPLPTGPTVPIKFEKAISSLPAILNPDSVYAVRVGEGIDLYVSDMTGNIAFKSNSPGVASTSTAGIVKVDGTTVTINTSGVISAHVDPNAVGAPIKTFNIIGTATAPLQGTAIFRPFSIITLTRAELTTSTVSSSPIIIALYKDNAVAGTFHINPGYFTAEYTGLNIELVAGSAVRADLISGTVTNFTMALY